LPEQLTLQTLEGATEARREEARSLHPATPFAPPTTGRDTFERERVETRARIAAHYDRLAPQRDEWRRRNAYYHTTLATLCREIIPRGARVIELGCATGELLAAVEPAVGVGVDLSLRMCEIARAKFPRLRFLQADAERLPLAEQFDYVIMSDLVGHLSDVWETLRRLHRVCHAETRIIVTTYNFLWQPTLALAERLGLKMPQPAQNWLGFSDLENLFRLTDFEIESSGVSLLVPARVPLIASRLNRPRSRTSFLANFGLLNHFILRPARDAVTTTDAHTVSVVVPCRNEAGNIAACVERVPSMGARTEIIFVDGDSTDGTVAEIEREIERWRGRKEIRLVHQVARDATEKQRASNLMLKLGKGDAVRKGFAAATGDMLMILDADLTVPPEDLPKFYDALARGRGELVNGTRLVYPLEDQSMKSANFLGNKIFSWLFTWLLSQRIKDTLCGTKALSRADYERIASARSYFGDFDPFGDFDLLFGAARLKLKIAEMPVRYRRRTAGETKVRVLRHGVLLARMCAIGFRRLKAQPWLVRLRRDGHAKL
jgi:glycosyltransferase involved in cell wall biosynthesis/SAM-dependent methyltransferase